MIGTQLETTQECKDFIANLIKNDSTIRDECHAHDIYSFEASKWKRTKKRFIRSDSEVDWILNSSNQEFIWLEPGRTTLESCVVRGFLHRDADCFVSIITDFNKLVAWTFQVD